MKKIYKVFGERLLVEPITEDNGITKEFKGVVKVLAVGNGAEDWSVKEGDEILVSGYTPIHGDNYVVKSQILRWN